MIKLKFAHFETQLSTIIIFIFIVDPITNGSSLNFKEQGTNMLTIPPCKNEEAEILEVRQCCQLLDKTYNNANSQQIMALMKYSLDLSNPWITQYFEQKDNTDSEFNDDVRRLISQSWFTTNHDPIVNSLSRKGDVNILQKLG